MFKKLGMLIVGITLVVGVSACSDTSEVEAAGTYVSIDINPSIEFIVDENDVIISFNLLNEDAEIICAGVDFIGMTIEEASELFIELATEAGYIDVTSDDNAVLITVIGDDETEVEAQLTLELQERIRERVMHFMAVNAINAQVFTEDFTQADLVAQAEELGVSPGKLKLVLLAQVYDEELLLEDGLSMPVKDLMAILRDHHEEVRASLTDEELALREAQKEALMQQFKQHFIDHVAANPNLTEEQIEARINAIKEHDGSVSRQTWEQRVHEWQNRMEDRNDGFPTDPTDDGTSE